MSMDISMDSASVILHLQEARVALGHALTEWIAWSTTLMVDAIRNNMTFTQGYSTGQLEASIQVLQIDMLETEIGSNLPYAMFVEYGTGQRGAASGVSPPSSYNYGGKAGMTAEQYLTPAWEQNRAVLLDELHRRVQEALQKW